MVECGIADPEVTGSIPVGCFFCFSAVSRYFGTPTTTKLPFCMHDLASSMLTSMACTPSSMLRCGHERWDQLRFDPRVSAQVPPVSTESFTKTISWHPYLLAIICNLEHSKFALTLQLLSYSVLKYPPCVQTVVLSRFDLLPHSQRIHNMEKRLQQTGKLTWANLLFLTFSDFNFELW